MLRKLPLIFAVFIAAAGAVIWKTSPAGSTPQTMLSVENLAIPENLGKIENRFKGSAGRWIIYIQDVHAHFTAQQNIAAIVDHISTVYGVHTAALEGGWQATRFPETQSLPSSQAKYQITQTLLERDYITGPAYAAMASPAALTLIGIEDDALYEENRQVYLDYLSGKQATDEKIKTMDNALETEKKLTFNSDLYQFDRAVMEFQTGEQGEKFLPALVTEAEQLGISLSSFPQIQVFKQILGREKTLDKETLKAESMRLLQKYGNSRLSFEEILRSGLIPADDLLYYRETQKYIEMMRLQDQLEHRKFFQEIWTLIEKTKEVLFASPEEKPLDEKSGRLITAKKVLTLQATPEDLKNYQREAAQTRTDLTAFDLEADLDQALQFYDLAQKRDEIFYQQLLHRQDLEGNVMVITGGFHTEGLTEKLEGSGISYLTITPNLEGKMPDEALYQKRLQDIRSGTLAENNNLQFTPEFDRRTAQAIQIRSENPRSSLEPLVQLVLTGVQSAAGIPARSEAAVVSILSDKTVRLFLDFQNLDQETQEAVLVDALEEIKKAELKMLLTVSAQDLNNLIAQNPDTSKILEALLSDRQNTLAIIAPSALDLPEAAYNADWIQGENVPEAMAQTAFQRRYKTLLNYTAVLYDGTAELPAWAVQLPQNTAALLLYRIILSDERLRALAKDENFWTRIAELLPNLEAYQQILQSA